MIDPTHGLRRIRSCKKAATKLVFLYCAPLLSSDDARPIKVRTTAAVIGLKARTVRLALAELVALGLLDLACPPRQGTPGKYRLTKAAGHSVPIPNLEMV